MSELTELRKQAASCTACELYTDATQTVFGAGQQGASIVLAGEQPGDQGDRQGKPFVGPAGKLLDRALHQARISRDDAYVTNVVKHFRRRDEMFNGLVADLELAGRTAVSSRGVAPG